MLLGIDTGGTYTDAVVYDEAAGVVVAKAKAPTNHHDLSIGIGATVMCVGPGLGWKTFGLVIVGFGGAPLYPLTVDRFYLRAGGRLDAVALGAYCALASGVAVTLGPLALGVLADSVGLRWALLIVPVLAGTGAFTQRSRRRY